MVAHSRARRGRTVRTNNRMDGSGGCGRAVWLASMTAAPSSWSLRSVVQPDGRPDGSVAVQAPSVMVTGPCAARSRSEMEPRWPVAGQAEPLMVTGPVAGQSRGGMEAPMAPVSGLGSAGWKRKGPSRGWSADGWKQMARSQRGPRRCGTPGYCQRKRNRNNRVDRSGVWVQRHGCSSCRRSVTLVVELAASRGAGAGRWMWRA